MSSIKPNMATMKAALFHEPNRVTYETIPIPQPGPGDVLVKIDTALTCGTDVKCYRRGHPILLKTFPSPFGHEFSGTVIEAVPPTAQDQRAGESTPSFAPGDRVVAANSAPCESCYYCDKGQFNLCEHLELLNGAYADYIVVPARIAQRNMHRLPDHLSFECAAFMEPLSVCLHGLQQTGVQAGDSLAVIGLGPIGQLLVRAATLHGAQVTALARNPDKLALAQSFGGAIQTVSLLEYPDANEIISKFTPQGRGFDIVIEAVGLPETWEKAVGLVRKGGTVNLFGGCPGHTSVTFPTRRLHYDELTLVSSFHHTPARVREAFDLLAEGRLDPRPLITQNLPMSRFEEALQLVEAGQAMKIALQTI
jgi:L-iditol 2-dehydrogenase